MLLLLLSACRVNLRRQNEKAYLIGHVKDVGVDSQHSKAAVLQPHATAAAAVCLQGQPARLKPGAR
jgi:hypothetical protein